MKLFSIKNAFLLTTICFLIFLYIKEKQDTERREKAVSLAKEAMELYIHDNDIDGATRLYEESIKLDGHNALTYTAYSQIYCSEGKVDKAFEILSRAHDSIDLDHTKLFALGLYADILNKRDIAIKYYKASIEKTPDEDDTNKVLPHYFINPDLSMDMFNTIKPTKYNKLLIDYVRERSMKEYVNSLLQDACGSSELN